MRRQSLEKVVREVIFQEGEQDTLCLAVALAVPELEAWLLADWQHTFEKDYKHCQVQMRIKLQEEGVDFDAVEKFDCRCNTQGYRKISETLRSAFAICCGTSPGYSKDTDTRRLLLQTDPHVVASRCPHFKIFWNELKVCLEKASSE